MGSDPSLMKFYLEERFHKIEIAFESIAEETNTAAQVLISRILISGTAEGGAVECKACDEGSIANTKLYMCRKCSVGKQPNE